MGTGTEDYYRHWAPGYDEVYTRPERQDDMSALHVRLTDWFAGKRVLEVAAGTGWWTSVLADTAASVTATDVNKATLEVARARRAWPPTVDFALPTALRRKPSAETSTQRSPASSGPTFRWRKWTPSSSLSCCACAPGP